MCVFIFWCCVLFWYSKQYQWYMKRLGERREFVNESNFPIYRHPPQIILKETNKNNEKKRRKNNIDPKFQSEWNVRAMETLMFVNYYITRQKKPSVKKWKNEKEKKKENTMWICLDWLVETFVSGKRRRSSFLLNKKSSITTEKTLHRCAKRRNLLEIDSASLSKYFQFPFFHASGVFLVRSFVRVRWMLFICLCRSFALYGQNRNQNHLAQLPMNTDVNNSSDRFKSDRIL